MSGDRLTPGDPLGGDSGEGDAFGRRGPEPDPFGRPAPEAPPPTPSTYGDAPVPPGAFAPRGREEVVNPFAGARPSAWWKRAVAATIDAAIITIAALIVFAVALAPLSLDDGDGLVGSVLLAFLGVLAVAVGALLYAPMIMASTNGKTLGKMAVGIRVVRADGRRIDFLWAAVREVVVKALVLGIASAITGGLATLADVLWPFVDKKNRALHDLVVNSLVVDD